jgi:deoxyribose-phosphate aldolase
MKLNTYIDHTLLKPTATPNDIITLCEEAITHQFYAVCVNGCYVQLAKSIVTNSAVQVASVMGFPLGANTTKTKIFEAQDAIKNGASEIDMVLNLGWLKAKEYKKIESEITEIKKAIGIHVLKVILETCYLTNDEIIEASKIAMYSGADFIKTSTGFGSGGATIEAVKLMKQAVGDAVKIKASGGIRDKETALQYIKLGVSRIGTSSGIAIVGDNN